MNKSLNNQKAKNVAKAAVKGHNGYDYEQIENADIRNRAEQTAAEINVNLQTMDKAFLDNGRKLLAIKEDLGHGHFIPWLEAEFQWSERTAQNYMNVAKVLADDYHAVAYLPSQTIYRLVANTVPDKVRAKVIAAAKDGKRMTVELVEAAMTKAKENVVKLPFAAKSVASDSVSEAIGDDHSTARRKASERLLQLIALELDEMQEFMRLAQFAGIQLSHEFLAAFGDVQIAAGFTYDVPASKVH